MKWKHIKLVIGVFMISGGACASADPCSSIPPDPGPQPGGQTHAQCIAYWDAMDAHWNGGNDCATYRVKQACTLAGFGGFATLAACEGAADATGIAEDALDDADVALQKLACPNE